MDGSRHAEEARLRDPRAARSLSPTREVSSGRIAETPRAHVSSRPVWGCVWGAVGAGTGARRLMGASSERRDALESWCWSHSSVNMIKTIESGGKGRVVMTSELHLSKAITKHGPQTGI